jgi:PAS domain S-box-containing protein
MSKKRRSSDQDSPAPLPAAVPESELSVRALLHELQVHSEEITVQNEQLMKAQAELEEARDRYADLYDFAPIGYMTLDANAVIRQINMAATLLFERQRTFLLGLPLVNLVDRDHRDRFRKFLIEANVPENASASVELALRTRERRVVRLLARPVRSRPGAHELFTALIDVTAERLLEAEKGEAFDREQSKSAELAEEVTVRLAAEERVKALLERLVSVQEQERRRLALNLHDQLGQQLTALRLALASVREIDDRAQQHVRFELIDQIMSQLDRDVDFLAWELRPAALDDVGLEAALAEFLRQWSIANGLVADLHHDDSDDRRYPPDVESNLYRIVQEALNNVSKHARATHVSVIIERRGNDLTLIVEDDGRGFDITNERDRISRGGMGLAGMQERAASIGGELELESSPGKGTTLFVRIPLSPPRTPESAQKTSI